MNHPRTGDWGLPPYFLGVDFSEIFRVTASSSEFKFGGGNLGCILNNEEIHKREGWFVCVELNESFVGLTSFTLTLRLPSQKQSSGLRKRNSVVRF